MKDSVLSNTRREMNYNDPFRFITSPGGFNGGNMWENMTRGLFSDRSYPQIVMINPSINRHGAPCPAGEMQAGPQEKNIPSDAGADIKRRRELNRLRSEMNTAIKSEDFEKAAGIRDDIYRLEQEK